MKKLLLIIGIICGINFYASSQQTVIVFEVTVDVKHSAVVYTQHYEVQADSVEIIAYKTEALDSYLNEKQPTPDEVKIIEDEKAFLNSERMRILIANHPERIRK